MMNSDDAIIARWSEKCDIYLYGTEHGYTIHDANENSYYNCTLSETFDYLSNIRDKGLKVPVGVVVMLQEWDRRNRRDSH